MARAGRGCWSHPAQSLQPWSSWFTHTVRNAASRDSGCLGRALGKQRVLIKTTLQASGSPPACCRFPKACAGALAALLSPPCRLQAHRAPLPLIPRLCSDGLCPGGHSLLLESGTGSTYVFTQTSTMTSICGSTAKMERITAKSGGQLGQACGGWLGGRTEQEIGLQWEFSGSAYALWGFSEHGTFLLQPCLCPAATAHCCYEALQHLWPQSAARKTVA